MVDQRKLKWNCNNSPNPNNDWLRDVIRIFWRCYLSKDLRIFGVKSFILFAAACSFSLSLALRHSFDFFPMFAWNVFFVMPLSQLSAVRDTRYWTTCSCTVNKYTNWHFLFTFYTLRFFLITAANERMSERTNEKHFLYCIIIYGASHLYWGQKSDNVVSIWCTFRINYLQS